MKAWIFISNKGHGKSAVTRAKRHSSPCNMPSKQRGGVEVIKAQHFL
jgi:hypothetical protein